MGEVGERGVLNECQTRVELFSGVEQPIIKNMSRKKEHTAATGQTDANEFAGGNVCTALWW